jgi:mono/diheme cytochrome c family protein
MMLRKIGYAALAVAVVAQLVPYGHTHENPPVVKEPAWNKPETRALVHAACFDCHSNETVWPWYSNVAPVSWFVVHDVSQARHALNFSEWQRTYRHAKDAPDAVHEGEMPLRSYRQMHAEARLTPEQKQALEDGLKATLGASSGNE